ncbi:putative N-acetylmannosamine-6-phosphate 2-epimerase [Marinovum sp.]|uniref:N-acetylmannosamine-6-phosphate 2-epimerase n=1 Tax=Marinovum sp. TaxID=2024839 RepID=UPI002B269668|nr:putative N-acetylmannosamine-6-phosphate 2-epimerase [Marinovum sp.]
MTLDRLNILSRRLIVSCQPVPGGPMDRPDIVAATAQAAHAGGAAGVRLEGIANIRAFRALGAAPVIGLIKRDLDGSPVRITPYLEDIAALAGAGADIIAIDATDRPRPVPVAELIAAIHAAGCIAMADCATQADARAAHAAGAEVLGSTMSGYTGETIPNAPDFDLVTKISRLGAFTIAEGRYYTPEQVARAITCGADAVVVGTALTRTEIATGWFADAVSGAAGT